MLYVLQYHSSLLPRRRKKKNIYSLQHILRPNGQTGHNDYQDLLSLMFPSLFFCTILNYSTLKFALSTTSTQASIMYNVALQFGPSPLSTVSQDVSKLPDQSACPPFVWSFSNLTSLYLSIETAADSKVWLVVCSLSVLALFIFSLQSPSYVRAQTVAAAHSLSH